MSERYEIAVYDENTMSGYCVLDKSKPSMTARLQYKNVFISTKEGCEIVCKLLNDKQHIIQEMSETIRIYDSAYIKLNKENKSLQERLDYIQNLISDSINHQKTKICQKALKSIIADYNDYLLGHGKKIKK